jgi:hypothetical protein
MHIWLVSLLSFIFGFAGGVVGWFLVDLVMRPVRRFSELRRDAKTLMLLLWDAPEAGRCSRDEWLELMDFFKDNRVRLGAVGAELSSFSQTDRFASSLVGILGYAPADAGRAAKRLAFELGSDIEDRDRNYQRLDISLKIRFDPQSPFYNPYNPGR